MSDFNKYKKIWIICFLINFCIYSEGYNKIHKENLSYEDIESIKKSYKSYLSNESFLKKISNQYNFIEYNSIGTTHNGLEIPALKINSNNKVDKIPIFFNCAHHANELSSTEHCYDIIYQIIKDENKDYLNHLTIWIVPIVNPDGSQIFWEQSISKGRKNGREVDLNRNYPFMWGKQNGSSGNINHEFYRGAEPLSENESKSVSQLAEQNRFLFSVSYHDDGKKILIPYTTDRIKNPSEDYPSIFSEKIAKEINYLSIKNIYPVNGVDQDYLYFKYGTIALLLESEKRWLPYEKIEGVLKRSEKLWREIINEAIFGNKIFLKIVDEKENLLSAKVEIEEIKFYNREQYYSSPYTGLFYRMVLKDQYTIKISHLNYITQKLIINSTKNNELKIIKMKSNN
jgi:hypothetical protein